MIIADGPDAYGYTIFCDDIRLEAGGKLTYVGVYAGVLRMHGEFPVTLPKFGFDIVYLQRRRSFVAPDKFIISLPGETEENPSITIAIPDDEVKQVLKAYADKNSEDEGGKLVRIGGPIVFTNLLIQKPGAVKVRVARGDEFIRLGALEITQGELVRAPEKKEAAN